MSQATSALTLTVLTLVCLQLTTSSPVTSLTAPSSGSSGNSALSFDRIRSALRAMLALNDGELQSLLGGVPPRTLLPTLSPSTALFLVAMQRKLQQLQRLLPKQEHLPGDMIIAKRRKATSNNEMMDTGHRDPDSLLAALAELSEYVQGKQGYPTQRTTPQFTGSKIRKIIRMIEDDGVTARDIRSDYEDEYSDGSIVVEDVITNVEDSSIANALASELSAEDLSNVVKSRSRRSQKEHHKVFKHKQHDNCKLHSFHPEFWFRPRECPPAPDGAPQLFCPTPDANGDWVCIDPAELCDDRPHCPGQEDELPASCLFYAPVRTQLEQVFFLLSQLQ